MYTAILGEGAAPSNAGRRNSIVLSGLSKPWGMPGLRMGWLIMENGHLFSLGQPLGQPLMKSQAVKKAIGLEFDRPK